MNHISFYESSHWGKKKETVIRNHEYELKDFHKVDFSGLLCRSISVPG